MICFLVVNERNLVQFQIEEKKYMIPFLNNISDFKFADYWSIFSKYFAKH